MKTLTIVAMMLVGCGGAFEPERWSCGGTTFEFEPDCKSYELRLGVAFALVGLFEPEGSPIFPKRPTLVVSETLAVDQGVGSDLYGLTHTLFHELERNRLNSNFLEFPYGLHKDGYIDTHYRWEEKGFIEAEESYGNWNATEEWCRPLKKSKPIAVSEARTKVCGD